MRIVHTADWHLGFRAYQRLTPDGMNVRERDVAITFMRLIDAIIRVAPDAVLVAGDIFHVARPSNAAVTHAFAQLRKLREALPETLVILAAGNHDAPKASESGCILPLFTNLGIQVVDRGVDRIRLGELSIVCVPDIPGLKRPEFHPDPDARYNVLLMHGEVEGVTQGGADRHPSAGQVAREQLDLDGWDYVALGHYHQYEELAPNTFYSGSIDYTSSNPWQEIATPKGFVERNLVTGEHTFHAVTPARVFKDLARLDAAGLTAEELTTAIAAAVEDGGSIDGQVIRLVVTNVSRELARSIDHKAINALKRRALQLQIDLRRPEKVETLPIELPSPAQRTRKTLEQIIVSSLETRELPPEVVRERFVANAIKYLDLSFDPYAAPAPAAPPASAPSVEAAA